MDTETLKNNIRAIKELILDEQKILTYTSISKELCVHVNEAKLLLSHAIEDIRKCEPKIDIYVFYVISGLLNNNNACTTVCSEADIADLKSSLKLIFYEHVYCVSRGVQVVDYVALTAVNKLADLPLCTGLIKSTTCMKRTDEEIVNLKCKVLSLSNESKPNNLIKKNSTQISKTLTTNGNDNVKQVEVKSEQNLRSKTPSPKKDVGNTANKTGIKHNGTKSTARGIAGFFSKSTGDSNKKTVAKVKEEKITDKVEAKIEIETKVKVEPSNTDSVSLVTTKKQESTKSKNVSASNSLKQIKKNAKVDKKRKRVLHVSDSESEAEIDPFADEEKMVVDQVDSEDEIPPTPSVNTVKITSGIINPKKKRKVVDKTYTDEDGYILTKKEEVYESCSDNEEETKTSIKPEKENIQQIIQVKTETSPKENGKSKKKKVSPPQKGKQSTLTNFFKKV